MFSKRPKTFDTINMVFCFRKFFSVANSMMFSKAFQRTITAKGISEVNRSFLGMLNNMFHQFIRRDRVDHFGVHAPIALQKPKYNAFSCCTTSTFAFSSSTKIRFVKFDFSSEFPRFQFAYMINRFTEFLIYARDRLIIYSKITCQSIRWLLLIKPSYDFQLATKKMASFLSLTLVAFYISAFRSTHFERSTKHTLFAIQKVVMVTYFAVTHHKTMYLQLFYGYIRN